MGINTRNLTDLVITPTLREMGPKFISWSAVELLQMTCAAETQMGKYLKQGLRTLDDGLARAGGIYQMEPATFKDVSTRFKWQCISRETKAYVTGHLSFGNIIYDLKYATIMARAKYYLVPDALPDVDDIEGLAHYYSKHWYSGEFYEDRKNKAILAYRELE